MIETAIPDERLRKAVEDLSATSGQLAGILSEITRITEVLDSVPEAASSDERKVVGWSLHRLLLAGQEIENAFGTERSAGLFDLVRARPTRGTEWFNDAVLDGIYHAPDGMTREIFRYQSDRGPVYSAWDLNDRGLSFWYSRPEPVITHLVHKQIVQGDGRYELAPVSKQK